MSEYSVKRIDIQKFDEAISGFESAIEIFNQSIECITKSTSLLLDSWEGEGEKQFSKVYNRLKTSIKDETENLIVIKDDLISIKESYMDWDSDMSKGISGK